MCRVSERRTRSGKSVWPLVLALGAMLVACSSGGDDNNISTTPCTDMEFAGLNLTPANGDVYFQEVSTIFSTCSSIDVVVAINNLDNIWTVGFDLTFDDSLVRYDSFTLGPLLQQGSPVNAPFVTVNQSSGTLQVTATRLPPDGNVNATGSQALMTLKFSRIAGPGTAMIDFNLSGGSTVTEAIQDDSGNVRPANFGPGHGGMLTVPL